MQTQSLVTPGSFFRLAAMASAVALFPISASAQYPSFFTANLSGSQMSPPTSSAGTAFGRVTLDDPAPDVDTKVRFSIAYSGLQGKATMIHVYEQPPTPPGAAPILRFTLGTAGGTSGFVRNREFTIPFADNAQAQSLRARNFYFLVKTTLHSQGEIRGQILPDNPYVAALNGMQVSPPNTSIGKGVARISLNADASKIMVTFKVQLPDRRPVGVHRGAARRSGQRPRDARPCIGDPWGVLRQALRHHGRRSHALKTEPALRPRELDHGRPRHTWPHTGTRSRAAQV